MRFCLRGLFLVVLFTCSLRAAFGVVTEPVTHIVFTESVDPLPGNGNLWRYGNGDTYQGGWLNMRPHGEGVYHRFNGDEYEGHFVDGYMQGIGTFRMANGDMYVGGFYRGVATGQGKIRYQNGNHYQGQILDGRRHGKGKLTYRSGSTYQGDWLNGDKEGKGVMAYRNGEQYVGDYQHNKPHGNGVLTHSSGRGYVGTFSKGKKHGVGECISATGDKTICLFDKGKHIDDPEKLRLAKAYFKKHRPQHNFNGGVAYRVQDHFTQVTYYIESRAVWWEKEKTKVGVQLWIHSDDEQRYFNMIVENYHGPGKYYLDTGDLVASMFEGIELRLPKNVEAQVLIREDKEGRISGSFNAKRLNSDNKGLQSYSIFDGRFDASVAP